jgi:hypothetical protein
LENAERKDVQLLQLLNQGLADRTFLGKDSVRKKNFCFNYLVRSGWLLTAKKFFLASQTSFLSNNDLTIGVQFLMSQFCFWWPKFCLVGKNKYKNTLFALFELAQRQPP